MNEPSSPPPTPGPAKFNWLPLYVVAGVLGVLTAIFGYGTINGGGFIVAGLVGLGGCVLFLAAVLSVIIYIAYWFERELSPQEKNGWHCALAIEGMGLLWIAFMVIVLSRADMLSIQWSKENGQTVATAVRDFKARHGRYPDSLEEVEKDTGRRLPKPLCASKFYYRADDYSFSLWFPGTGFLESWSFDDETGAWSYKD
jgi:hypothetical protein